MNLDIFNLANFRGFSSFGGTEIVRAFGWILGVIVILLLVIEPESWYRAEAKTASSTTTTTESTKTETPAPPATPPATAKTATTSTTSTKTTSSTSSPARPPVKPLTLADLYPKPHITVQPLPRVLSYQPRRKRRGLRRILDLLKKIA